jgi:hypothetical protein
LATAGDDQAADDDLDSRRWWSFSVATAAALRPLGSWTSRPTRSRLRRDPRRRALSEVGRPATAADRRRPAREAHSDGVAPAAVAAAAVSAAKVAAATDAAVAGLGMDPVALPRRPGVGSPTGGSGGAGAAIPAGRVAIDVPDLAKMSATELPA